jgi:hypothetical protein
MPAASEPVAGGPHRRGIDIGLGEPPATEPHRNFLGIDFVVFGFAAVDGFPLQGMPEDKRHVFSCTPVGQPVPGKEAFDTDDKILPIGRDGFEKGLWASGPIAVHQDRAIPMQDAEGHRASVPVDTARKLVLLGVESHEVSSSCE